MATITKVSQFNNEKHFEDFYIIHNGLMQLFYVDPDYGYVEFFKTEEDAKEKVNETLQKPFADADENLYILKVNGLYGVFDDNMDCMVESSDIWPVLACINENDIPRHKFPVFIFNDDKDEDDDYDADDYYDHPPSYYDPRYDGPMHYIPPGNH